jgi:hypothetical protein
MFCNVAMLQNPWSNCGPMYVSTFVFRSGAPAG